MKYALFLQDLSISRDDAEGLLREAAGRKYEALWHDSPERNRNREDIEALITRDHQLGENVLQEWPNLQTVSLAFTGYDGVDLKYCRGRGLKLYYVPDYSSDSVAELTVGLTLAVLRKIPRADDNMRKGRWDRNGVEPGTELQGKRVGIVGTGAIGTRSAKLFQAFGCNVVGFARSPRQSFLDLGLEYASLDSLLSEADVVALHLPLSGATRHLIGARELALMKPTAVLINTARTELVNTGELIAALTNGVISGAGLDVSAEDPASPDELLKLENVVLTPHLGFKTDESLKRLAAAAIANVGYFLTGSTTNLLT
jgi:lactate dehydrogenase-like 2-hydroxyacid dehydrogenase